MVLCLRLFMGATILLIASFTGCILSAKQPVERPVLRAVYGDFYPYNFRGENGEAQGYGVDVVVELAQASGYDIEFIEADNPKQFFEMMARGEVDISPLLALTPERRAAGLTTTPLGEYVLAVYVHHNHQITKIEALSGQRVGVVSGSITQAAARLLPLVKIVEYPDFDALLLPLLNGEIDAVVAVAEMFDAQLRINDIKDKVRQLQTPLAVTPYGIIVRREYPEVHAAFERAIRRTTTPERLARLRAYWFGRDRSIIHHPLFNDIMTIFGGIALTTVALGIYNVRLRRRSARMMLEHSANQLLIDALDKMRAAIVVFDKNMKAIHWNSGFECRFEDIVPALRQAAKLEDVCAHFSFNGRVGPTQERPATEGFAQLATQRLRAGQTHQQIVHTQAGQSFDLSMFPLGERYFAAIWVDITELHGQQEHIASQGRELMRKNQQLLSFSAMAAHDLKAPLLQQRALVEFITEDLADAQISLPTDAIGYFETLSDLSGRMSGLVTDLLDFAKADSEQDAPQSFVPNTRLDNILKLAAPDCNIVFDIMPDMPAVRVDPAAFDMVMRNLITNAVKHHDRPSGKISVRAHRKQDQIIIDVQDDGPGIAPEFQARVFDPFARLTSVEGTGLGLAFVRKTAVAWGGEVRLRSSPGDGCTFSVSVPAGEGNVVELPAEISGHAQLRGA